MVEIRETVRRFVLERFLADDDPSAFSDTTDLKERGILDSFSILSLVSFIESEFEIELEAADLASGSLFSVTGIENLVRSRRAFDAPAADTTADNGARLTGASPVKGNDHDEQSHSGNITLYQYFMRGALKNPEGTAIVDGQSSLTYQELAGRVDTFADELRAAGVKPHDQAALILGSGASFIIAILAVWKVGAVVIPLDPQLHEEEFLKYFLDSSARILITSSAKKAVARFLNENGALLEHAWFCSSTKDCWIYESPAGKQRIAASAAAPQTPPAMAWPALTQYSTGSTGTPKRVTRTHEQLVGEFLSVATVFKLTASDRILGAIPFFHSHGLKNAAMLPLFAGATLYVLGTFFPRDAARLIARERITIYPGVPFMFQQLAALREHHDFSSLRWVFSGAALLPQATVQAFEKVYSIKIRQVYGTTETGLICVQREPADFNGFNRVGTAIPGVVVQIVDQNGDPVPEETDGRIKVTSPFAASRFENSSGNSECYFENGSYFPGDLGRMRANGELMLSGRQRGFINVGGNKVDPAEVEAALLDHAEISEAVVFGIPDSVSGERVKAVVVASVEMSSKDIRAHLAPRLAEFKHPRAIEFRSELPKSPLGKVQRKHLMGNFPEDASKPV